MENMIISILCILAIGVPAWIIARKYDKAKEEISRMKEQHDWEIQRLNSQITTTSFQQIYAETEAQRLYQEQLNMKLDAIDAGKAMLREAMRYQNDNRV